MLLKWNCQLFFKSVKVLPTSQLLRWNHYKILGLTPSASTKDVKTAYYKLSKLYHPDRNNGSEASAQKFRDIVTAYEVLGKADSRLKYDLEILRKCNARNPESSYRKKKPKKRKKSSFAPNIKSNTFPNDIRFKSKYKNRVSRTMSRAEQANFETFIIRTIPFVVACLMNCKKRQDS